MKLIQNHNTSAQGKEAKQNLYLSIKIKNLLRVFVLPGHWCPKGTTLYASKLHCIDLKVNLWWEEIYMPLLIENTSNLILSIGDKRSCCLFVTLK